MDLRVAGIVKESVVDGPGFRYVVFAQGCTHGCKGCHNPDTHDLNGGYTIKTDDVVADILSQAHIDGVTFSGGEPFLQPEAFTLIGEKLKEKNIHIVCYSGFTFETLLASSNEKVKRLLGMTDMLIDGPYMEEYKDLSLTYRGSRNQRIVDVHASLDAEQAVLEKLYREAS